MKKSSKTNSRKYTTRFISRNFYIKAYGINKLGQKINTLFGVARAIAELGEELLYKFIDRAIKAGLDKCVCKLRRGLQITLYCK